MSTPQSKKLSIKPGVSKPAITIQEEQWINNRNDTEQPPAPVSEKTKRITFDVSENQHRAIKTLASQKGKTVKELMTELVEQILKEQSP